MSWSFNNPFHPVYSLIIIMIVLCIAIYAGRIYLIKKQKARRGRSFLAGKSKYSEFNVLKNRQRPMFLALFLSVSFAFLSLNWTIPVVEQEVEIVEIYEGDILQIEEVPRTIEQKKEIPKPEPSKNINFVEHPDPVTKPIFTEPEPDPIIIGKNTVVKKATPIKKRPSDVPMFKPKRKEAERIFQIVEDEPLFGNCDMNDKAERKACATAALFQYLKDNLNYPTIALETGIQGNVIVQFIVEKDGSITGTKILRGIGGGCDEEAQNVIENMPKWTPGRQRGRPVRVQFTLPVKFVLQ